MALLELQGIAKHFGAIEALKGIDLAIEEGQVVGLMGDNGAGKSTLVRIIAGNFRPSEGEIRIHGAFGRGTAYPRALRLMSALGVGRLVTRKFPLEQIEDAFAHAAAGRGVKTMITPAG